MALETHAKDAAKARLTLLEDIAVKYSVDGIWAACRPPTQPEQPARCAVLAFHAALFALQDPLHRVNPLPSKGRHLKDSKAALRLWQAMHPCMWTGQDPVDIQTLVRKHRPAVAAAVERCVMVALSQATVSPKAVAWNWTLRNSFQLLLSLPFLSEGFLATLSPAYRDNAAGQSAPSLYPSGMQQDSALGLAWQAINHFSVGLTSGADGLQARSIEVMLQSHLQGVMCTLEATHRLFFHENKNWDHMEGYPSPLLLLEVIEKAVVLGVALLRRWHAPVLPRMLALQHILPLEATLSSW
eukprot:scaffold62268_cov47-Prasinocladus_malaysianus.AAC.1